MKSNLDKILNNNKSELTSRNITKNVKYGSVVIKRLPKDSILIIDGDNIEIVKGDTTIAIDGEMNIEILGDVNIKVTGNAEIEANEINLKTGDASQWKPNVISICPYTGAPHGGETSGIIKLKGD